MNKPLPESSRMRHRPSQGFTLIELMIAVGIVAILTAIAYPSYRNYVIRGQLVDATTGLASVRANMERYFQDNRSYTTVGAFNPPAPCNGTAISAGKFTITCASNATTFTATAVGAVGSGDLTGFTFTVDQSDNQVTTVAPPAPTAFQGCPNAWITKTGGC
jgi:prepilin-type N-terminal cleavage/methylation domain-containing protein